MSLDLRQHLKNCLPDLAGKQVTLGFDGFIDSIVRLIQRKSVGGNEYFQTIEQFGQYTLEKKDGNFSLEMEEVVKKSGGNMPIMAGALARWNMTLNCVGALGHPVIDPLFASLPANCRLFSFADPGVTTALEFNNGKIILGEMSKLNAANWDRIKEIIGRQKLIEIFGHSDLMAILNWSEMDHASDIWKGLLQEVLPAIQYSLKPYAFFDLSDFSKRNEDVLLDALSLLSDFSQYWRVVLGLNLNEARLIYQALANGSMEENSIESSGDFIFAQLKIDSLLIHYHNNAFLWNEQGRYEKESEKIQSPVLSTGAGDNFNAGFCVGLLCEMNPATCLELGHLFAGTYMRTGQSAAPEMIR